MIQKQPVKMAHRRCQIDSDALYLIFDVIISTERF